MRAIIYKLFYVCIAALTFSIMSCGENPADGVEKVVRVDKGVGAKELPSRSNAAVERRTLPQRQPKEIRPGEPGSPGHEIRPGMSAEDIKAMTMGPGKYVESLMSEDGSFEKAKVPAKFWAHVGRADTNGDEKVSKEEAEDYSANREAERIIRELQGKDTQGGGAGGRRSAGRRSR